MPDYDYECAKCGKTFEKTLKASELDRARVECPACGSAEVRRLVRPFFAFTSRKS